MTDREDKILLRVGKSLIASPVVQSLIHSGSPTKRIRAHHRHPECESPQSPLYMQMSKYCVAVWQTRSSDPEALHS